MKRILLTTLIVAASSFASLAHAQGAYLGADVIYGHYTFDVPGTTNTDDSANSVSGRILAGYNFNPTWAIEGGYADFGSVNYNFITNGANANVSAKTHSLYLAAKATILLDEKFSLYGKLGVSHNDTDREWTRPGATLDEHVNQSALYESIGVQYKLTDKAAATLELEHYGPLNSFGSTPFVVSTGLRYKF